MFCWDALNRHVDHTLSLSPSLSTIFDLSRNDHAIGDLPNERLAIEDLAISECWRCCCECCCCTCHQLLRVNLGAGRGVGSLSYILRSPFCTIIELDFVCQNRNPWTCARDYSTQQTASSHNALCLVSRNHRHVLLHLNFLPKVWRRWCVFPPCFLILLQWALFPGKSWGGNALNDFGLIVFSNELLRRFLAHLDHNDAPISWPLARSRQKGICISLVFRQEYFSNSFPLKIWFPRKAHRIKKSPELFRTRASSAAWLLLHRTRFDLLSFLKQVWTGEIVFWFVGYATRSRIYSFLGISQPRMFGCGSFGDGILISNPCFPWRRSTMWTSRAGPITVPPGIAANSLEFRSGRGSMSCWNNLRNSFVLQTNVHPVPKWCKYANYCELDSSG